MKLSDKVFLIQQYFDEILPNASCELTYNSDYGFLISVMLSAQCTDKKVNKVTDVLFEKYKTLEELNNASLTDIENMINSLGLYKNKAKNIKSIAKDLLDKFNGVVPTSKDDLMGLSGVGNKTSNVVRVELFKIPEFPVDTHVARVSKRLGLVKEDDDVLVIEEKLKKEFPKDRWILLHHQFIHFGRYFCKALAPKCNECKLSGFCNYIKNKSKWSFIKDM